MATKTVKTKKLELEVRQKEAQRLVDLSKSTQFARWERDKLGSTDRSIMDAGRTAVKKK